MDTLERRRESLEGQMEEGRVLKEKLEKRSDVVGEYFEDYFGEYERKMFDRYLRCKVKLCIEMREMEELIRTCEHMVDYVNQISHN